jgi:hypothetical protein
VAVAAVALGAGAVVVAGSVVVVEVEVALETAVGVEVVVEADSEIVVVVEGVEAALTVAALATSLARRLPSKALSTRPVLSVRLRLLQLAYAASITLRRQVLAPHVMVILSACQFM